MINYQETASRWLAQAADDLAIAKKLFQSSDFSYTCFFAEQSAQKSLKAFLIRNKEINITTHSITELLERASSHNFIFKDLIETSGKKLDKYYLATRYPDALPPSASLIPSKAYTKDEAEQAVGISQTIFDLCD